MTITYYDVVGGDKQLNEIVVAGSHDGGINSGRTYVQTQKLNVLEQAGAGVRVFDLRIAAAVVSTAKGAPKKVELKAYHGSLSNMKNANREVVNYSDRERGGQGSAVVTRSKMSETKGAFGEGLVEMLAEAKEFVRSPEGQEEFLILKFDKCYNWPLIAEACTDMLGRRLYKAGGNLNTTKIRDLRGKVVVLFSGAGVDALPGAFDPTDGILKFKNLSQGAAYSPNFPGLQYYGKGGTKIGKLGDKIGHNETKQSKLMRGARDLLNPQIVGMMYWTTTGAFENIRARNKTMWQPPTVQRLRTLWSGGLGDYLQGAAPLDFPEGSVAQGAMLKRFIPNIVMIDFASARKCGIIRDLNTVLAQDLADLDADGDYAMAEPIGYVKPPSGLRGLIAKVRG